MTTIQLLLYGKYPDFSKLSTGTWRFKYISHKNDHTLFLIIQYYGNYFFIKGTTSDLSEK